MTLQSPDFTVTGARMGTLHLDRQFAPGSLVDLAAETSYEVTLIDRTAGRESAVLEETIDAASGFVGKDAAVTVVPGHTYAISIATTTSSSVVGTGLLGGTTSTRFDNKRLFVRARCPAAIGRSCRVTLQGLLQKRKAATTKRTVKIAKGKSRRIVLEVKPKAKGKVAPRKRLLFKQTVVAGPAKATAYKRLKLIHR